MKNNWLGYGARPYTHVEAAPGKYYVPSKHPFQATLSDGLKVQEAYPGQYYLTHPVGSVPDEGFLGRNVLCLTGAGLLLSAVVSLGAWALLRR